MQPKTFTMSIEWTFFDKDNPESFPLGYFQMLNQEWSKVFYDKDNGVWRDYYAKEQVDDPIAWIPASFIKEISGIPEFDFTVSS